MPLGLEGEKAKRRKEGRLKGETEEMNFQKN